MRHLRCAGVRAGFGGNGDRKNLRRLCRLAQIWRGRYQGTGGSRHQVKRMKRRASAFGWFSWMDSDFRSRLNAAAHCAGMTGGGDAHTTFGLWIGGCAEWILWV